MSILVIFLVAVVLLLFLLNTRRWKAVGRGMRQTRRGFEKELHEPDELGR